MNTSGDEEPATLRMVPAVFVVLWASGFVVARLVAPYASPETFVALRFVLSALVLTGIVVVARAPWPRTGAAWLKSLVAGALMQGVYVGGVFWAIKTGMPAAIMALIAGLQPLLTGILAWPLLGERVSPRRWLGLLVGFAGAVLVLAPKMAGAGAVPPAAILAAVIAMLGITFGTFVQKRIGEAIDLRTAAAIQFMGGVLVSLPLALALAGEQPMLVPSRDFWIALAWGVLVLSVATNLLLLRLLRRDAVAKVTSLFYLVPPITALMALALFGEALTLVQIAGMAVAAGGVAIADRG